LTFILEHIPLFLSHSKLVLHAPDFRLLLSVFFGDHFVFQILLH
jgi:hypothetical protein